MRVFVHTQGKKSEPPFTAFAGGCVALCSSCCRHPHGGLITADICASLGQIRRSHASLSMLSRGGQPSIFTLKCSPEGSVVNMLNFSLRFGCRHCTH